MPGCDRSAWCFFIFLARDPCKEAAAGPFLVGGRWKPLLGAGWPTNIGYIPPASGMVQMGKRGVPKEPTDHKTLIQVHGKEVRGEIWKSCVQLPSPALFRGLLTSCLQSQWHSWGAYTDSSRRYVQVYFERGCNEDSPLNQMTRIYWKIKLLSLSSLNLPVLPECSCTCIHKPTVSKLHLLEEGCVAGMWA